MSRVLAVIAVLMCTSWLLAQTPTSYLDRYCKSESIPSQDREKTISELTEALKNNDMDIRWRSVDRLACFGESSASAVPQMILLFKESNGEAQLNAVDAVAYLGAVAVPALTEALSSTEVDIRRGACRALRKIGPPAKSALPALTKLVSEPGYDVSLAAERAIESIAGNR